MSLASTATSPLASTMPAIAGTSGAGSAVSAGSAVYATAPPSGESAAVMPYSAAWSIVAITSRDPVTSLGIDRDDRVGGRAEFADQQPAAGLL